MWAGSVLAYLRVSKNTHCTHMYTVDESTENGFKGGMYVLAPP